MSAARDGVEIIAEFEAMDEQFHRAYGPDDDKPDLCELRKRLFRKAYDVVQAVGADPSLLLPEPEWTHSHEEGDFQWQTPVGGYHAVLRSSGQWRACIYSGALSEIKMCETADEAKAACEEHYRNVVKSMFLK